MIYGPPRDTCTTCGDCTRTPSGLCQHGGQARSCVDTCRDVAALLARVAELETALGLEHSSRLVAYSVLDARESVVRAETREECVERVKQVAETYDAHARGPIGSYLAAIRAGKEQP